MPPSQSLISINLMCSFCSFIITPWFGEIPNNFRQYFLQDKEWIMVQLWRCWTMIWWNWIALMEAILLRGKSNWLGFEEVFKWWIDHNEVSMEHGLNKQSFMVGKTRWWFFHIVDALKAMFKPCSSHVHSLNIEGTDFLFMGNSNFKLIDEFLC